MKPPEAYGQKQMLDEERQLIEIARAKKLDSGGREISSDAVGLALSGGGIRSAAFHVGVLQGLATHHRLNQVDYVSAVSGGGYVACWLVKLFKELGPAEAERSIAVSVGSPSAEVLALSRRAAAYLTPRIGLLTPEVGLLLTTYIHTALFNLTTLFLLVLLIEAVPRAALSTLRALGPHPLLTSILGCTFALGSVFLVLLRLLEGSNHPVAFALNWNKKANLLIWVTLLGLASTSDFIDNNIKDPEVLSRLAGFLGPILATTALILPHRIEVKEFIAQSKAGLLCFTTVWTVCMITVHQSGLFPAWRSSVCLAVLFSRIVYGFWQSRQSFGSSDYLRRLSVAFPAVTSGFLIVTYFLYNADRLYEPRQIHTSFPRISLHLGSSGWVHISVAIIAVVLALIWVYSVQPVKVARWRFPSWTGYLGAVVGAVTVITVTAYRGRDLVGLLAHMKASGVETAFNVTETLIAPAAIVVGTFLTNFTFAFVGRIIPPFQRERITGLSSAIYGITLVGCMFPTATSVWGPVLASHANPRSISLCVSVFVLLGIATLLAPRSALTRSIREAALNSSPYFVLVAIMILASWMLNEFVFRIESDQASVPYSQALYGTYTVYTIALPIAIAYVASFVSARFGINMSSMHVFYQNRLSEAFLQESAPGRKPHSPAVPPENAFEEKDDTKSVRRFDVSHLEDFVPKATDDGYCGPYLILNATLNLSGSKDLAVQERKATNFIFSPRHCGFGPPGSTRALKAFERTSAFRYGEDAGIRLALAMAVSGSALGSSMGRYTSVKTRIVNTVFNVRLGWWLTNPAYPEAWRNSVSRSRLTMLLAELFGFIHDEGPFVHLSDGGHFENLGLYELVRRKCGLIFISDASKDSHCTFASLGTAIERCRTDFGYEIDIDVKHLGKDLAVSLDRQAYAIGRIKYSDAETGILIYLKASKTHSPLPLDIKSFSDLHPDFPHDSTFNQWFSESQFESYRMLGFEIAQSFCETDRIKKSASASA